MKDSYLELIYSFFSKPILFLPFLLSLILNIIIWLSLLIKVPLSASGIPLHYNIYFGIDWFGAWIMIFIYPMIALVVLIINFLISLKLHLKDMFLTKLINLVSLLVQVIILTGIFTILMNYFR